MNLIITEAPKIDHNPYDECCVGSHQGETATLELDKDLKLVIQQMRSGIGPSYNITVDAGKYGKRTRVISVYVGDDGELYIHFKGVDMTKNPKWAGKDEFILEGSE